MVDRGGVGLHPRIGHPGHIRYHQLLQHRQLARGGDAQQQVRPHDAPRQRQRQHRDHLLGRLRRRDRARRQALHIRFHRGRRGQHHSNDLLRRSAVHLFQQPDCSACAVLCQRHYRRAHQRHSGEHQHLAVLLLRDSGRRRTRLGDAVGRGSHRCRRILCPTRFGRRSRRRQRRRLARQLYRPHRHVRRRYRSL